MPKFVMPAEVRNEMQDVIAKGVYTFIREFAPPLFPAHAYKDPLIQDCIAGGIAEAVRRYQAHTGQPIATAVAL